VDPIERPSRAIRLLPWSILALVLVPAVWHVVDFESDVDPEYPAVVRPTYSPYPPAAYRLAEPGDTLDRVSLYLASAGLVLAALGWLQARPRADLWPAALAASGVAWWHAATPWPAPDGWHGLGWRVVLDPRAPLALRAGVALLGLFFLLLAVQTLQPALRNRQRLFEIGRQRGVLALLALAAVLVALRQTDGAALGPPGYWPRWGLLAGLLALDLALLGLLLPGLPRARNPRLATAALGALAGGGLIAAGLQMLDYQRPIPRLKAAVPGRIYISAMPDYRGLQIAHDRHQFRTIINLFPEDTPLQSPLWPQELQFVADHGIRYLRSPANPGEGQAFLEQTLRTVQDPAAWPVLVHCHGCMDRTPAWLGIYRYLVEGRPLDRIYQEIERHRGYRPKASVTLLYAHMLPRLGGARFQRDPAAATLQAHTAGTPDPYTEPGARAAGPETQTARRSRPPAR
jgi:hypothetical protein